VLSDTLASFAAARSGSVSSPDATTIADAVSLGETVLTLLMSKLPVV
jgi:hypothetical protein